MSIRNLFAFLSVLIAGALTAGNAAGGAEASARQSQWVNDYAVAWDSPSVDARGSMPLGNGDIGLNVWVVKDGDLWFYISKSDSWGDNPVESLLKVGRVRVRFSPNPFTAGQPFLQKLDLAKGRIEVRAGKPGNQLTVLVWVDANRPVIHVESQGESAHFMEASFEPHRTRKTRLNATVDTVMGGLKDEVAWCYQNQNVRKLPELQGMIFGALMRGEDLGRQSDRMLASNQAGNAQHLAVHVLTRQPAKPDEWLAAIHAEAAVTDQAALAAARQEHETWWGEYWDRSWIRLDGDETARYVTQAYILQRFKNACAGRGNWPLHFNGSIFTVEDECQKNPDFRSADFHLWGPRFWMQNMRHMYWPMLQSGDFDLMQPFFRYYRRVLEVNRKQVKELYGFDGAFFRETTPMYGGIADGKHKMTPASEPGFTNHHINSILEFCAMALDYYRMTRDEEFAREILIPVADAGLTFFSNYFPRDPKGLLLLEPDNALEAYWKVRNPAPDIAGLRWVTAGLLELPSGLAGPELRKRWEDLRRIVPPIPLGLRDGKETILPYENCKEFKDGFEEPQLYAVWPYRFYGVGKPDLERAQATYDTRKTRVVGCWHQNSIIAAYLGLAADAQDGVATLFHPVKRTHPVFVFRNGRRVEMKDRGGVDNGLRFPAFWGKGHDWLPDEDHGGIGMNTLQLMLMQCEGRKIRLLPAWPRAWNGPFKLHAPELLTTVEGRIVDGKVLDLKVTPESRAKDVEICPMAAGAE